MLLKNTEEKARQRKVWSHNIAFHLLRKANALTESLALMLDGDTCFTGEQVLNLYIELSARVRVVLLIFLPFVLFVV